MVIRWERDNRGAFICQIHIQCFSLSAQFNHVNSLKLIARAHQLVQEGYKYMFDEQLVTVWSAPNYCYRCGNMASILTIREDGSRGFTVYEAAEENERDKGMMKNRKLVSKFRLARITLLNRNDVFQGTMPYFV